MIIEMAILSDFMRLNEVKCGSISVQVERYLGLSKEMEIEGWV